AAPATPAPIAEVSGFEALGIGSGDDPSLEAAQSRVALLERELQDARQEIGILADERDRALSDAAISLEDRERLSDSLTALQSGRAAVAGALEIELASARALVAEIEDIATGQLCDEDETSEYAIGANDAAVLVLNALAGADAE
ncbi:MAG: hypothetical protein Q7T55_21350, partial [Solirubrobacteraceae bacterium]|nr:hypothetical protein [Solirubrobacteraceae bacterium]